MTVSSRPAPLRILLSEPALRAHGDAIAAVLQDRPWTAVLAPAIDDTRAIDADIAFVSRDVTGLSTKHEVLPSTQRFYTALLEAPSLRWTHVHSAGADRPVYVQLRERGVKVTTSSGPMPAWWRRPRWPGCWRWLDISRGCWRRSANGNGRR